MGLKQRNNIDQPAPNLIQIMTVSLFIILLAFFILLNSIAVDDEKRQRVAIGSLVETFGVLSGGNSLIDKNDQNSDISELPFIVNHIDFSDLFESHSALYQDIRITSHERGTAVNIPMHLLFDGQATRLKPGGDEWLQRLGRIIGQNDFPVEIACHTDATPQNQSDHRGNRELSSIRSLNILRYFIDQGKISPLRFTAYGWGEYRPIASSATRETRELNRRAEFIFVHPYKLPEKPKGVFTFKDFFFNVFD